MNHKRLYVIARYNEDISWVEELQGDIIVYNKGENYRWNFNKIDVENYGRESETYVRAIIDHYDKLSEYDDIVFLQGYCFDHSPDLMQLLNYTTDDYIGLGAYFSTHTIPKDGFIFNTHKFLIDVMLRQSHTVDHGHDETKIFSDFSYPMDHGNGNIIEKSGEIKQLMYVMTIMGIPYKGVSMNWTNGALYTVNTNLLKNKTLSFWKDLHELIRYWYVDLENQDLGYILERLWPVIWKHQNNFSGWKF